MKKRSKYTKSRDALIRLQKWHVDEIRRKLAELQSMHAEFERKRAELAASVADERKFGETSPIGAFAYPSFARAMNERSARLEESIKGIEREIALTKDALNEAYSELKKIEVLEDQRLERERIADDRAEQAELDDIALKGYRRSLENQA